MFYFLISILFDFSWSASHGKNKQGEPLLYNLLGKLFYKHKNYGKAQKYYIRGTEIDEFVSMLTEYASSVLPSEVDLIIARAVLQFIFFLKKKLV